MPLLNQSTMLSTKDIRNSSEADEFLQTHTSGFSEAFVKAYSPENQGCLVIDAGIPGMNGLKLMEYVKSAGGCLPTIMMADHANIRLAVRAMKAGAAGFLEKPVQHDELLTNINRALESARNLTMLSSFHAEAAQRIAGLTTRERQVMELVVEGKLIYLYDDNHVTLSSGTDMAFTEDRARRFESYGWHVQSVADGNDLASIDWALRAARKEIERPSMILVRTHIGYGSPHKHDSFEAHGSPLGEDEVRLTKQNLGWPVEPPFYIPEHGHEHFRKALERGKQSEKEWKSKFASYTQSFPDLAKTFTQIMRGELPDGWDKDIPVFPADAKGMATRIAGGKVMNAVAPRLPALMGGSADLNPSTFTALAGLGDFEPAEMGACDKQGAVEGIWNYAGRNMYFGVREHGMGAILNGLAAHGGIVPFGATFLIFSDYMRPSIRLAALMKLHVIYIFTHDSIALGQDGPTHQPVEQLAGLRSVPDLTVNQH